MYEQLLAHLTGDYLFQFGGLGKKKAQSIPWALLHGLLYVIPFIFFCHASWLQLVIIIVLHALQDWWLWSTVKDGKYMSGLEGGITIVRDNTLHMILNYFVLGMKILG